MSEQCTDRRSVGSRVRSQSTFVSDGCFGFLFALLPRRNCRAWLVFYGCSRLSSWFNHLHIVHETPTHGPQNTNDKFDSNPCQPKSSRKVHTSVCRRGYMLPTITISKNRNIHIVDRLVLLFDRFFSAGQFFRSVLFVVFSGSPAPLHDGVHLSSIRE